MQNPNENKDIIEASEAGIQKAVKDPKSKDKPPRFPKLAARWQALKESGFGVAMSGHFNRQGYLYWSFIMPAALFMMVFILQGTFPVGHGSALVLDMNGQYVYFFEALRKAIYGDASLLYSWCGSLGSEFLGVYAYYLASPLSYLVALFPQTAMTEFILFLELLKCGLCGLTMAYYLKKSRPRANEMITISIATMYALCAYGIVMAHNTMWIDALIWLPLLVLGIESLINKGRFTLFIVALAMTMLSNFYIGYMTCIFVFVYFFYYYFFASDRTSNEYVTVQDGRNNFYGEKHHFVKTFARMGGAAVIALLISMVIVIPTAYSLSLGKNEFSTTNWDFVLFRSDASKNLFFKINPLDFITKMFIASYDTVRRDLVYNGISYPGMPFLYCGMLALILVPVYFISKRVSKKQKIGAALILGFFFLSMLISPMDIVWHGFQNPNWLNYRYSFMFSFLMLILSHRALELWHTVKFKKTVIIASVWAALGLVCAIFTPKMFPENKSYLRRELLFIFVPLLLLAAYTVIHYFLIKGRHSAAIRSSVLATLSVVICLEMFVGALLNSTSLAEDVTFSPKYTRADGGGLEGYDNFLDKIRPTVDAIQAADTSFYRMEKGDGYLLSDSVRAFRKYDDNYALNMRGVTGSTSTLNARTIKFLNRLGYVSTSNISRYKGGSSVTDSLLGIKYVIYSKEQAQKEYYLSQYPDSDSFITECNDSKNTTLYAYRNKYALSLAYAANSTIKDYNITTSCSPLATVNNLITALLGEKETVHIYQNIPYLFTYESGISYSNSSYSENLYDKYGNEIPSYDPNGNLRYTTTYDYPLVTIKRYTQADFEAEVRKEFEKKAEKDSSFTFVESEIKAEAKKRYDDYRKKYEDKETTVRCEKGLTPYHTFTFKPCKNEDGSFVYDNDKKIVYPSVSFTFTTPDTMKDNTEIYFSLPTKYQRECYWTFTPENPARTSSTGTMYRTDDRSDCLQIMGTMGPGEKATVTVTFKNTTGENKDLYIDNSDGSGLFFFVDPDVMQSSMERLAEGNFVIEEYTESHFVGKIRAQEGMTSVFTTIPYEEYWEVTVDGRKVDTYMTCAALVGFDLPSAGEHTVEIQYKSKSLRNGAILTVVGLVLFAAWIVIDRLVCKKRREALPMLTYDCYSEGDYQSDDFDEELKEAYQNPKKKKKKK